MALNPNTDSKPMRFFLTVCLLWLAACSANPAYAFDVLGGGASRQSEQSRTALLAYAPEGIGPGKPLWLGLQIQHAPHWHSYWKNPGDSGLPTELRWTLPQGLQAAEIVWPAPKKIPLGDLANYGYEDTVLLPVPVTVGADFQAPQLDVTLHARWLICRTECLPEEGTFELHLPTHAPQTQHAAAFAEAERRSPLALSSGTSRLEVVGTDLHVRLEGLAKAWHGQPLEWFPEIPGLIVPGAPWTQGWEGQTWHAQVPISPQRTASPASVALVLTANHLLGGVRLEVPVRGGWPPPDVSVVELPPALQAALASPSPATASTTEGAHLGLWAALLGAFAGGMLLNLMPCVFPVLAIKVVAFARHGDDHHAHRVHGLAYTAGVVLSFLGLGGLLLGLRATGEALGWGFQLQEPAVVAVLAALFTLMALNLAGMFEFGHLLPNRWAVYRARHPVPDAFVSGVLAVAVASPCTGPFMGASLGLAIALPAAQALAVFVALGLGMAAPYLAASWWPGVARVLPRPGAWMETFRRAMAFPMLATVVWLLWVLGQQTGTDGVVALLALLLGMAAVTWVLSLAHRAHWLWRVACVTVWLALAWGIGPWVWRAPDTPPSPTQPTDVAWQAWSPVRQAQLLAEGRPVFVDFTAAWCVTCQYNKHSALADAAVLRAFGERKVALLRADWTRRDPVVTDALRQLGRNGVPVYALYAPQRPPVVLTEVLRTHELLEAISAL